MTTDDAIIPTELPKPRAASGSRKGRSLRAPSGARADRPELAKVIRRLEARDVLLATRLDRLARSTSLGARVGKMGDSTADSSAEWRRRPFC
jgi:hypothetical protein